MKKIRIRTRDGEQVVETEPGSRLDDAILSTGILLDRPCGGWGKCGQCRVKASGELSDLSEVELAHLDQADRDAGVRLACQARVIGDTEVMIDAAAVFTDKNFSTGADLDAVAGPFGLAIDLGTTTVAVFITGLDDGRVYAGSATLNQQARHGAEVMSRLLEGHKDPESVRGLAWSSIKEAATGLGLDEGVRSRVEKAVVVGNSAMHHLALGLPVDTLFRSPFEPYSMKQERIPSGELTEFFPVLKEVMFAPLLGGFVGSDSLACLAYFGLDREEGNAMALDLGTNGEVMVKSGERILVASTAAGPAFEGVNISCGVRAVPGAVTAMSWDDKTGPVLRTINDERPIGLTGSGLLSAVRTLRDRGAIDRSGRIAEPDSVSGVKIKDKAGVKSIVIAGNVCISQPDVRELQKAKAAVAAAVEILLKLGGLDAGEVSRVILTGSFGGRLNPEDVIALGVIPEATAGCIHSIPNGAGMGAAMMLDDDMFAEALGLTKRVEHVELNLDPDFMDRYVANMILEKAKPGTADRSLKPLGKEEFV